MRLPPLVLLPLVYLVHFFLGLVEWHASSAAVVDQPNASLPRAARAFVMVVVASGVLLLGVAIFQWHSPAPVRFISYLTLAVIAGTLKIRLPGMRGTISPSFVLVLMAIVTTVMASPLFEAVYGRRARESGELAAMGEVPAE